MAKRLIDAEEIEKLFYAQIEYGATDLMDAFDDALQDATTVDAVEVVRCKDCKHCIVEKRLCTHPQNRVFNTGVNVFSEHYCSYGERKEG